MFSPSQKELDVVAQQEIIQPQRRYKELLQNSIYSSFSNKGGILRRQNSRQSGTGITVGNADVRSIKFNEDFDHVSEEQEQSTISCNDTLKNKRSEQLKDWEN